MRILVDTNILVDYLLNRENFFEPAEKVVAICQQELANGAISSQSIADMFYLMRKNFSVAERKTMLLNLCDIFHVEGTDEVKVLCALVNDKFSDFEDCLQMQCALSFRADYIVTRNVKDFAASEIPAVTPEEFCRILLDA